MGTSNETSWQVLFQAADTRSDRPTVRSSSCSAASSSSSCSVSDSDPGLEEEDGGEAEEDEEGGFAGDDEENGRRRRGRERGRCEDAECKAKDRRCSSRVEDEEKEEDDKDEHEDDIQGRPPGTRRHTRSAVRIDRIKRWMLRKGNKQEKVSRFARAREERRGERSINQGKN